MAEIDRSKRYANPPKPPKKKGGMQDKAEVTAEHVVTKDAEKGKGPTDMHPGPVGHVGEDPGPQDGKDATWGVVAARHKEEHSSTIKRHAEEGAAMHERHGKELKDMMGRHHKEMQTTMEEKAAGEEEKTAGKQDFKEKAEGTKGSEP